MLLPSLSFFFSFLFLLYFSFLFFSFTFSLLAIQTQPNRRKSNLLAHPRSFSLFYSSLLPFVWGSPRDSAGAAQPGSQCTPCPPSPPPPRRRTPATPSDASWPPSLSSPPSPYPAPSSTVPPPRSCPDRPPSGGIPPCPCHSRRSHRLRRFGELESELFLFLKKILHCLQ